ncbi:MAG: NifB/NifX family molybdenum-iron cluster-binding protein [Exilispira sp.]|jgi:predicted Fe-Mo cluster-binding NifX family protein|nr:NifB/NifX family molybdenum-iron cluster-binding protein [Exilispira sp.]
MKICIPVEGLQGLAERLYGHFGSSPYFLIYDTDTKEVKTVKNNNEHHVHGACQPTGLLQDENISAVLTTGMGRNALLKLNALGIKIYLLKNDEYETITVEKAINLFNEGKCIELTSDFACNGHGEHHHHGH